MEDIKFPVYLLTFPDSRINRHNIFIDGPVKVYSYRKGKSEVAIKVYAYRNKFYSGYSITSAFKGHSYTGTGCPASLQDWGAYNNCEGAYRHAANSCIEWFERAFKNHRTHPEILNFKNQLRK